MLYLDIEGNDIVGFREKPLLEDKVVSAGIYLFNHGISEYLPEVGSMEKLTFPVLAQKRLLKAYRAKWKGERWLTVNSIKDLSMAENEFNSIRGLQYMKVLLTGILGFIGSHLAERLVNDGDEVYGMVRRVANRNMDVIKNVLNDVTLISGDMTDYASTRNAIKTANPDVVVHLAALSPVRDSFERPFEYQHANLMGTMNVAHSLLELPDSQTRKIAVASTAEVYGLQEKQPLKETLTLKPSSPYAVSKAAGDLYVQMMFNAFNLHGCIMRPTNSYGRKFDQQLSR